MYIYVQDYATAVVPSCSNTEKKLMSLMAHFCSKFKNNPSHNRRTSLKFSV